MGGGGGQESWIARLPEALISDYFWGQWVLFIFVEHWFQTLFETLDSEPMFGKSFSEPFGNIELSRFWSFIQFRSSFGASVSQYVWAPGI